MIVDAAAMADSGPRETTSMASIMVLPKIGVNMEEATIVEWVVKPGDAIREGQHIVTVETDKASQEIYSSASGTIVKLLAEAGQVLKCQEPLAVIAAPGEAIAQGDAGTPVGQGAEGRAEGFPGWKCGPAADGAQHSAGANLAACPEDGN